MTKFQTTLRDWKIITETLTKRSEHTLIIWWFRLKYQKSNPTSGEQVMTLAFHSVFSALGGFGIWFASSKLLPQVRASCSSQYPPPRDDRWTSLKGIFTNGLTPVEPGVYRTRVTNAFIQVCRRRSMRFVASQSDNWMCLQTLDVLWSSSSCLYRSCMF